MHAHLLSLLYVLHYITLYYSILKIGQPFSDHHRFHMYIHTCIHHIIESLLALQLEIGTTAQRVTV